MSALDFAPLYRSAVGFDRVLNLLQDSLRTASADVYPPYNIEKTGEQTYRITLAVAGFGLDDIAITAKPNQLVVAGKRPGKQGGQFLHHGITHGSFERRFELADHIEVVGAALDNGLLAIELKRELPEAMKPRTIQIKGAQSQKVLDQKVA